MLQSENTNRISECYKVKTQNRISECYKVKTQIELVNVTR